MTQAYENTGTLKLQDISVMRGDKSLCAGLGFTLAPSDMLWVKGSNGIGKTSLLLCIAGLLRPETGTVLWNGQDVHKHTGHHCAFQGHQDAHKANLTCAENLAFWQDIYGSCHNIYAALKRVGLWEQKGLRAKSLSAGQSRRLSLARLLIKNAPLWILDEPAAAMDTQGREIIQDLLHEHIARGGCALLASHGAPDQIGTNTRLLTMKGDADA